MDLFSLFYRQHEPQDQFRFGSRKEPAMILMYNLNNNTRKGYKPCPTLLCAGVRHLLVSLASCDRSELNASSRSKSSSGGGGSSRNIGGKT